MGKMNSEYSLKSEVKNRVNTDCCFANTVYSFDEHEDKILKQLLFAE